MKNMEQQFYEYIEGSNELYFWLKDIEDDFNDGKRINKTKYNKIKQLEKEKRKKAVELLDIINRNNSRVKICMPPKLPAPPPLSKQEGRW